LATDAPLQGRAYARLFPEIPPLEIEDELLCAMGRQGGACDGASFAERGTDDARGAAGWPFFGQFVAHDISADRSTLVHHADVAALRNARRQKVNLEFLYGAGPAGDPYLFDASDPSKLLLGRNEAGRADDVQRNAQGTAIIGDPRNDTHLVMAQLHLAFCRLHNVMVDRIRSQGVPEVDLFERARRMLCWHYQWVVLHDFLPRVVGPALAEELLANGARYYHPGDDPYVPLEFADAAYRYGHAQIRHSYRLNGAMPPKPIFPDLLGFQPVPAAHVIDWTYLFDVPGHPPAQRAKKIDGRLCGSLITLPAAITGQVTVDAHRSLAARDLQRGLAVSLPSGEAVARRLGITPLSAQEDRTRSLRLGGGDAALVLHPQGGRGLRRGRPSRGRRGANRWRGAGRTRGSRSWLVPSSGPGMETGAAGRGTWQLHRGRLADLGACRQADCRRMTDGRLCLLPESRADEAIAVLVDAFHDYPVMRYEVGDAGADYDRRLHKLISLFVARRLDHGHPILAVERGGAVLGVATLTPPGEPGPPSAAFDARRDALWLELGQDAKERMERLVETWKRLSVPGPQFHLNMLGVRPHACREGPRAHPPRRGASDLARASGVDGRELEHGGSQERAPLRALRL
jgi:hypothetical protein